MIDLRAYVETLDKKTIAVLGLGASGLGVVRAFVKAGARVYAWDDSEQARAQGEKEGAVIAQLDKDILTQCDCLVAAPGVPLTHPAPHLSVSAARELGIEIIGDVEIFYRAYHEGANNRDYKIIALTGTNGKSTTTTLIHHILNAAGTRAVLGGNIGVPVLDMKLPPKGGVIVLELSSFQIDLCPRFTADIAVLLNLTPDHIDRHGTMEDYAAIKERLFRMPDDAREAGDSAPSCAAVISVDDDYCADIFARIQNVAQHQLVPISVANTVVNGVYVEDGVLYDTMNEAQETLEIGAVGGIAKLQGVHNHQNIAAAYACARLIGIEPAAIYEAIKTYPGLAHRQFPVRVINGVSYVNDSKATNAEAAAKALACSKNIYWIVGGKPKEGGLKGLEMYQDHIKHAFLIGAASEDFAAWMDQYVMEYTLCHTLDVAVTKAHNMAQTQRGQPGGAGVVLLSPACASYDQFKSFEHRGDVFTALVLDLPEEGEAQ